MAERVRTWCRELTSHSAAEAQAARSAPVVGVDFPGSQPVSLSASNLALLEDGALDYLVSWKADGTRYLLLLLHGGAYLLDRAGRVRRCQMRFPAGGHEPGKPHKPLHTHEFTLLDGEMVVNVGPGGERRRVFLAYDCCALGRTCTPGGQLLLLTARPFRERYQAIESVAAAKHHFDAAARERYLCGAEPFRLERKPFFEPERAQWRRCEANPPHSACTCAHRQAHRLCRRDICAGHRAEKPPRPNRSAPAKPPAPHRPRTDPCAGR